MHDDSPKAAGAPAAAAVLTPDAAKARNDFLLRMYDVKNKQIEQQFGLAWQAVSIFAASVVALVSSTGKVAGVPAYVIISLYLFLVTWALEVIIDAAFWYNRNLVMIANIEKQFLTRDDAHDIHWYFASHRPFNKPVTFLLSLILFLCTLAVVTVLFYFFVPEVNGGSSFAHPENYLPLLVMLVCIFVLRNFSTEKNVQYLDFTARAPGIDRKDLSFANSEHTLTPRGGIVNAVQNAILGVIGIQTKG